LNKKNIFIELSTHYIINSYYFFAIF